ncbi:MAG: helix-turn-helix transcriptional regulator [Pseudomonadota bacterium]
MNATTSDPISFGDFIRTYRFCHDMTQIQLSQLLGISKQRLCDIEKGRNNISIKLAQDVADKMGCPKEQLVKLAIRDRIEKEGLGRMLFGRDDRHFH